MNLPDEHGGGEGALTRLLFFMRGLYELPP